MRLLIGLVLTALCMFPSTASAIMVFPTTFYSAAGGYEANAVRFDGSNDYLLRGAGLSGASDSKVGILSFWFQFQGGDGSEQAIFAGAATTVQIVKTTANKIRLILQNSGFAFWMGRFHIDGIYGRWELVSLSRFLECRHLRWIHFMLMTLMT